MQKKLPTRLLSYAATATALSSGAANASIVYQSFEKTLVDTDTTNYYTTPTDGSIQISAYVKFNGTNITLVNSSTDGGTAFTAIDYYVTTSGGVSTTTAKATSIQSLVNYVQTPEILTAGQAIGEAFTQTTTLITTPAGAASNVYLGVSTPSKQYGWIRFSYTDGGKTITIHDAAFETIPGKSIVAGSTTETQGANLGLLGLAGGLASLRRKRSEKSSDIAA